MRIPALVLGGGLLLFVIIWLILPTPAQDPGSARTDLPWQIEVFDDGSSAVFGLHLGHDTLADAIDRFGPYEELVLFAGKDGDYSLEAWFGTVRFGPLKAKLVAKLQAPQAQLAELASRAVQRKGSPTGDWKLFLDPADLAQQRDRPLYALTYIPSYGGLDAAFFRKRLGEPAAWQTLEDGQVRWFYPDKGLSLLLDPKGKEVLEYVSPRAFKLPAGVTLAEAGSATAGQ